MGQKNTSDPAGQRINPGRQQDTVVQLQGIKRSREALDSAYLESIAAFLKQLCADPGMLKGS